LILKKDNDDDSSNKPSYQTIPPISIKNELQILQNIQNICQENLYKYKSEYEEDLKLLNQYETNQLKLSNNQINCLLMRIGEKKILNFWVEFTKYTIPLFDLSSKMIKKKVKKDYPHYCPYEMYINDVILALIRMSSSNK
jgi:histone-lysine N-methyltransferase SETD3